MNLDMKIYQEPKIKINMLKNLYAIQSITHIYIYMYTYAMLIINLLRD